MSLYERFLAEVKLSGLDHQWKANHVSIEQENQEVTFSFNYFSQTLLDFLPNCFLATKITAIEFSNIRFHDLEPLTRLPNLTRLRLRYYYFIPLFVGGSSRRKLDRVIHFLKFPKLRSLKIEEIYPEELEELDFTPLDQLEYLELTINSSLTARLHHTSVPDLPLPNLQYLSIKYLGNLSLPERLLYLPKLHTVRITASTTSSATQDMLQELAGNGVDVIRLRL